MKPLISANPAPLRGHRNYFDQSGAAEGALWVRPNAPLWRAGDMAYQVISPAPESEWREILHQDSNALATQTPEWTRSMVRMGSFNDASRLYVLEDGQRLLLPLARRSYLGGAFSTLHSFSMNWGMGGLLSSQPLRPADLNVVFADLKMMPDIRIAIRPNPLASAAWKDALPKHGYSVPRVAHVLNLEGGFPYVWEKRFKSTARTAVRKAEKSNLTVECDTTGRLIPVFYDLFNQSLLRWAEKQHEPRLLALLRGRQRDPVEKWQTIAKELGSACQVWVAYTQGQPAAALIVLQGANASYTRGAMDKDLAGPVRANDLLQRLAIESACQAGCRYYHMGETGASSSLAAFKSNFGAEAVPYDEIFYERLPFTRLDQMARTIVKKVIGFKDV